MSGNWFVLIPVGANIVVTIAYHVMFVGQRRRLKANEKYSQEIVSRWMEEADELRMENWDLQETNRSLLTLIEETDTIDTADAVRFAAQQTAQWLNKTDQD